MGRRFRTRAKRDGAWPDEVRVRVVDPDALAQLLAAAPRLEHELRLSAHERLRRAR